TPRRWRPSPRSRRTVRRASSSPRAPRASGSDAVTAGMDARDARLLNEFQHGFPRVTAPFAAIADALGADEAWVRATLACWQRDGRVSRVGAVFRPGAIGVSTLAALAVPPHDLERVAAAV